MNPFDAQKITGVVFGRDPCPENGINKFVRRFDEHFKPKSVQKQVDAFTKIQELETHMAKHGLKKDNASIGTVSSVKLDIRPASIT